MFGSEVLDVAIGLILVYLLLSLFATAVREAVESAVKTRAVFLEMGIRELLDDPRGAGLARGLYEHPLVFALYRGSFRSHDARKDKDGSWQARERMKGGNLPTYIPSATFARALVDLVVRGPTNLPYGNLQTAPLTLDGLRSAVGRIDSPTVQRALLLAIDEAGDDLTRARQNIARWFDVSMERVSAWYRRRTYFWLLVIGALTAGGLNVNTITIAQHLARSKAARELVVGRAQALVGDSAFAARVRQPAPAGDTAAGATASGAAASGATAQAGEGRAELRARMAALDSLNLPIGWDRVPAPRGSTGIDVFAWWAQQIFGLLLTALAVTLGAPFWFDLLNRVVSIRSTVKPGESAPRDHGEEGATERADRQRRSIPPAAAAGAATTTATLAPAAVGTATALVTTVAGEENKWAGRADDQEGII